MAEINTNKTAESSWVVNTSWNTGRDDDGWWMSKSVANPTTYTDVKTRMLPHKDWIPKDFAADDWLHIETSTNRESATGEIVISRTALNYYTRATPAVKEANWHLGVLYKVVVVEGLLIASLIAITVAMWRRKLDLVAVLTPKTKAKK